MTKRVQYISLIIIALTGYFMGERIYEDHELQANAPTLILVSEETNEEKSEDKLPEGMLKETKEVAKDILDGTKQITQDILSGTQKATSDVQESFSLETKTSSN